MRLIERIDFTGAEFVEEDGHRVVKNVVMLGPVSSHGYEYEQPAMAGAVAKGLYEGVRIFINHKEGNRDLMDLAGVFRETRHEGGKVKGNAHLLDDDYGRKFWNIAKSMPEAAGCSHVADGKLVTKSGKRVVEDITKVHSVDLVIQGATTRSMFESGGRPEETEHHMSVHTNLDEQLDRDIAEIDEKRREISRILDPAYETAIRRQMREEQAIAYEAKCRESRDNARRVVEIAGVLLNPDLRETDAEFAQRCGDRRRLREETARLASQIANSVL